MDQDRPPRRLDQHRLVGGGVAAPRHRPRAPRAAPRCGRPGASAPPRAGERSSVCSTTRAAFGISGMTNASFVPRPAVGCPLDRVGDRGGGDRRRRPRGRRRGRRPGLRPAPGSAAAGRRRGSRPARSRPPPGRWRPTGRGWRRRRRLPRSGSPARSSVVARRRGDDDRAHRLARPEGVERPLDHRPSRQRHESLRAAGSEALPGAGGRDDCGYCRGSTPWWRSAPPAARRGTPRRPPRPCRART